MNRLFLVLFFKYHLIFPNLEKINESHKMGIVHFSTQRGFFKGRNPMNRCQSCWAFSTGRKNTTVS